jgi:predicted MPP superfamily phosphohydrolase
MPVVLLAHQPLQIDVVGVWGPPMRLGARPEVIVVDPRSPV